MYEKERLKRYNEGRNVLLGMTQGKAQNRLRKSLLFLYVQKAGNSKCYRCGKEIESVDDFSIEHKEAWQSAKNPKDTFFDLGNIAFSHLGCNCKASRKDRCKKGHLYTLDSNYSLCNGKYIGRRCKICARQTDKDMYNKHKDEPEYKARRKIWRDRCAAKRASRLDVGAV